MHSVIFKHSSFVSRTGVFGPHLVFTGEVLEIRQTSILASPCRSRWCALLASTPG